MDQLQQSQFQMEARLLPIVQLVEGAQHDLQKAGEIFFAEEHGGARGAGALVAGDLQQLGLFAAQLGHQRVAQIAHELPCQLRRTVAGVEQSVNLRS